MASDCFLACPASVYIQGPVPPPCRLSKRVVAGGAGSVPPRGACENSLVLSDEAVVACRNGLPCVAVRVGDTFPGQVVDISITAYVYRWQVRTCATACICRHAIALRGICLWVCSVAGEACSLLGILHQHVCMYKCQSVLHICIGLLCKHGPVACKQTSLSVEAGLPAQATIMCTASRGKALTMGTAYMCRYMQAWCNKGKTNQQQVNAPVLCHLRLAWLPCYVCCTLPPSQTNMQALCSAEGEQVPLECVQLQLQPVALDLR